MSARIAGIVLLAAASALGNVPQEAGSGEVRPGLVAEFFRLGREVQDFPELAPDHRPAVRRVDRQINYSSTPGKFADTDLDDCFYVRWTGLLRVPRDGTYTFYLESDDGSRLWIDGRLVVENGGLHPMEEKSGERVLQAGDVEIRVEFYENMGEAGCRVSWEADGIPKEPIPETALFHRRDKELDR
ncbi:MAG: PA14 domain-containing protein [Planctomycetota bacterium]